MAGGFGHRLRLRLFLEGVEVPVIAANFVRLAAQLHRDGIAVALLEPRGTGGSCVRGCALLGCQRAR